MSNLIKHVKNCSQRPLAEKRKTTEDDQHVAAEKKVTSTSKNDLPLIDSKQQSHESSKEVVKLKIAPDAFKKDVQTTNINSSQKHVFLSDNLIRQMSFQNIKMKNTVAKNKGKIIERSFRANVLNILSNMSIGVCETPSDGNCLFGAICHQLHRLEIGSEQHKTLMEKLRMDVVKHIENNMTDYLFIMKDRIYHKNPGIKIIDLEKEIKCFLEQSLSKDKCWGGVMNLFMQYQLCIRRILLLSMKTMIRI